MRLIGILLTLSFGLTLGTSPETHAAAAVSPPSGLDLLNKAVFHLEQAKTLDSVSRLDVYAGDSATPAYRERVHFVLEKPDAYHADVTVLTSNGSVGAKYMIVCHGARVWIDEPAAGQYAVLPRSVFEQNDLGGLGLFGSLVCGSIGSKADALLNLKDLAHSGLKAQAGTQMVDGTACRVVSLQDARQGDTLEIALDPADATVRRLALNGQQQGQSIRLAETVTRQTNPATLSPALFWFTPPAGSKRVPALTIGPFAP